MKRIIIFEVKKIFRNRLILFMVVLFSFLNIYHIYDDYQKNIKVESKYYEAYFKLYKDVSGDWNSEKIEYVIMEYEKAKAIIDTGSFSTEPNQEGTYTGYIFGDYGLFEKIKNEMEKLYHYDNTMKEIVLKAEDNALFYTQKGNIYQANVNKEIEKAYQNRKVTAFYDTFGLTKYLKYDFSTLLILILLIPMFAPLFSKEYEIEMYDLLKLSLNFGKLSLCKLIAGAISICLVSVLFFLEDYFAFSYLYHISGLKQPLYTLSDFFYTPLNMSVGKYLLLNAAVKILGFLIFEEICIFISALLKNEMITFCLSFSISLIMVLTDAFVDIRAISFFNPVTLFSNSKLLKEFQVTCIGNLPVYTFLLPVLFNILELIILAIMTILICKNKPDQRFGKRRCRIEI